MISFKMFSWDNDKLEKRFAVSLLVNNDKTCLDWDSRESVHFTRWDKSSARLRLILTKRKLNLGTVFAVAWTARFHSSHLKDPQVK